VILHFQIQKVGISGKAASFGRFYRCFQITQRRLDDNARLGMRRVLRLAPARCAAKLSVNGYLTSASGHGKTDFDDR
jgi:hypothetical protein